MLYKQAARLVANRRYNNVRTFKGGLPAWKKAGYRLETGLSLPKYKIPQIDSSSFKQSVGEDCIVDIRSPKLYGQGLLTRKLGSKVQTLPRDYLKKYFHKIPLAKLSEQYKRIPHDRTVVVMDYRGKQAMAAAKFLKHKGYEEVRIVKGGLSGVENEE